MSDHIYHRLRALGGTGVTVRESGREIRLSVGSSQRMRCSTNEAWALLAALADTLGADMSSAPAWVADAAIEVSDR